MGAAASTFFNIGPAFDFAGPYGSYEPFPDSTKLVMVVMMWIGRIEIFPVLNLLTVAFWRSCPDRETEDSCRRRGCIRCDFEGHR